MDVIRGIVDRVLSRNEQTGRSFLIIRHETPAGLVEAKLGAFTVDLEQGDFFVARGDWAENVWKGKKEAVFNATKVRPDAPQTKAGAKAFLKAIFSPEKHGISGGAIDAAVDRMGDAAIVQFDRNPDGLTSLSSEPGRYRSAIFTDWGRRSSNRQAVSIMEGARLAPHVIDRVLDAFRDSVFQVISEDPYRLARVPKVGFEAADKVGKQMNIPADDARRIQAALMDALARNSEAGHTYMQVARLIEEVGQKISVDKATIQAFLQSMLQEERRQIVVDRKDGVLVAQLQEHFFAEAFVAKGIVSLLASGRRNAAGQVEAAAREVMKREKFARFDDVQARAIRMAVEQPVSILTGGPGTGKSTVTEAIVEVADRLGEKVIYLAAPTGKAANRLEEATGRDATTVHRLLRAREDPRTGGSVFMVNRDNPLPEGAFVIVDETSMLDVDTMAAVVDAMPRNGRLLMVGDKNQLPSVGAGAVLADMMKAKLDAGRVIPVTELVNVYRQKKNSAIATGAREIQAAEVPYADATLRGGLAFFEHLTGEITEKVRALVTGPLRKQLNLNPFRDIAVLCPQAPGPAGTWEINRRLSAELNAGGRPIEGVAHASYDDPAMPLPRIGDRVMLTENDDENDVMNGDTGIIRDAVRKTVGGKEKTYIRVEFDCGVTVDYPVTKWRSLILAYASTVHKSQGSQYQAVILPLTMAHEGMLDRTLLYTGWTRAQSVLILVGEREALETAVSSTRMAQRDTRLDDYLVRTAREARLEPFPIEEDEPAPRRPVPVTPFQRPAAAEPVSVRPAIPAPSLRPRFGRA